MKQVAGFYAAAAVFGLVLYANQAPAAMGEPTGEAVITPSEASQDVAVTDIRSHDGVTTGVLVNKSPEPIRDVKVLIAHVWFWNNERHPGDVSPSRSEYYTVRGEIPPGGSLPFRFETQSLPQRQDGHFEARAHVTEYTEVGTFAADQPRRYHRSGDNPSRAYDNPNSGTYAPPASNPYTPPSGEPAMERGTDWPPSDRGM